MRFRRPLQSGTQHHDAGLLISFLVRALPFLVVLLSAHAAGAAGIAGTYVGAMIIHFGATQPVPVLEIKSVWFGGTSFRWDFTRAPSAEPPPEVYVHRWTSSGFNSAGNCRAPKTNNR